MRRIAAFCVSLLLSAAPCAAAGPAPATPKKGKTPMPFALKSSAFAAGGTIPKKFTCDGEDASPPLSLSGVPAAAKSLALIMDDPDAPPGTWVHWVLYDLPPGTKELGEGLAKNETLPDGSRHGLCWGVDSFTRVGYHGPCPPPGKPHRYFFRLFALDKILGLPPRTAAPALRKAMAGHVLAETELIGRFGR